jgi:integrase
MRSRRKAGQKGSKDKLRKVDALIVHESTEGERSAAKAARRRMVERMAQEAPEKPVKTKKTKKPVRLTAKFLRDLAAPATDAVTYWDNDPKLRGFGARVYAKGSKSFFLNYRVNGVEKRHTIGSFPVWSVEAAREKAKELRRQIDSGHDPAGQRQERREAPTLQDLIDRYVTDHLPQKTGGPMRIKDEKAMLGIIADQLGKHEKVTEIHNGDIMEMHLRLTKSRGPIRANRILSCTSKMFSLACIAKKGERQPWRNQAEGNPCKGTPRNPENQRERFFDKHEIERIVDALAAYPGVGADVIRLIMLTGCRPGEARLALWSEFDRKPGYWIKPSAHTKQKKRHEIPLAPEAVELIETLRKKRKKKDYDLVFPGDKPGQPLQTLYHVWKHVLDHAKLASGEDGNPARPYDLRHTFATVGAGGGLSLPVIGRLLGHTQARTTQRYAHVSDEPLRKAADMIGGAIAKAGRRETETVPS